MFANLLTGATIAWSAGNALAAGVARGGVNIAGFDFGCDTSGNCTLARVDPPTSAADQMNHFVKKDKLNMFRLNVGWQYLVQGQLGGNLNNGNMAKYDNLVKSCLATGAHCVIDIHNYARWDGAIIGQGGPTDDQFAGLWSQLASKYANETNVVMGLMNEPHGIPNMTKWAATVQAAVAAIRTAGATNHTILLPGNDYTSAATFAKGSGPALLKVTNPDGSTDNLVFDVHKYLDADNSGTNSNCVGNQIDGAFAILAIWLRANKRQALVSEIGGGSDHPSCLKYVCEALDFLNRNSDVYLGYLGWSAGAFDPSHYILSLTPKAGYIDQPLMTKCFAAKFRGIGITSSATKPSPPESSITAGSGFGFAFTSNYDFAAATSPSTPAISISAPSTGSSTGSTIDFVLASNYDFAAAASPSPPTISISASSSASSSGPSSESVSTSTYDSAAATSSSPPSTSTPACSLSSSSSSESASTSIYDSATSPSNSSSEFAFTSTYDSATSASQPSTSTSTSSLSSNSSSISQSASTSTYVSATTASSPTTSPPSSQMPISSGVYPSGQASDTGYPSSNGLQDPTTLSTVVKPTSTTPEAATAGGNITIGA